MPFSFFISWYILVLRDAFFLPKPQDAIELRAFTHGLQPKSVPAMMAHFVTDWQQRGVDAWNEVPNHWQPGMDQQVGWWSLPEYLGDAFIAPLLGAPPGTCILQPNVHTTVQSLLSCAGTRRPRREVLITQDAFPSVAHSLQQWAPLLDLNPIVLPAAADGFVDEEAILKSINPSTAFVILNHVSFLTGEKLRDAFVQEVAETARRHGTIFVLDGYHCIGAQTSSVEALNVDVYMGGLLKQGSGSSGNGFLYVREGLDLQPASSGWVGDADPFGFNTAPLPHPSVRRRFLGGTPAIASMYHAVEGARLLLDTGLDVVRQHCSQLSDQAIRLAPSQHLTLRSPGDASRRGTMLVFEVEHAKALSTYLKTLHVYTDSRQDRYLRLAPFVWNTEEEIERASAIIKEVLAKQLHLGASSSRHPGGPVT